MKKFDSKVCTYHKVLIFFFIVWVCYNSLNKRFICCWKLWNWTTPSPHIEEICRYIIILISLYVLGFWCCPGLTYFLLFFFLFFLIYRHFERTLIRTLETYALNNSKSTVISFFWQFPKTDTYWNTSHSCSLCSGLVDWFLGHRVLLVFLPLNLHRLMSIIWKVNMLASLYVSLIDRNRKSNLFSLFCFWVEDVIILQTDFQGIRNLELCYAIYAWWNMLWF